MTAVQILSDLHLEFHKDGGQSFLRELPVAADTLVLAGDIVTLRPSELSAAAFARLCERFAHVVFVPGNHEYYRSSPREAHTILDALRARHENLHILNPGVLELDGQRLVGATLWFPELPNEDRYRGHMSDFRVIDDFVPWVHQTHAEHLAFLQDTICPGDIVITHHLPHPQSITAQFAGNLMNRFFCAADAAPLVEDRGVQLWIHGHTHAACDYTIGRTRVICNPHGYPLELKDVDLRRVVELTASEPPDPPRGP